METAKTTTDGFPAEQQEFLPAGLPDTPSLDTIQRFERQLQAIPEKVQIEPVHYFADGLYGREITIPADTVLTGKIHKAAHLNFLMRGEITVWTEQGMKRLTGPQVIVSQPGAKRVGLTHTETVWITVHASKETELDKLEAELIEPENHLIEGESPCLGST